MLKKKLPITPQAATAQTERLYVQLDVALDVLTGAHGSMLYVQQLTTTPAGKKMETLMQGVLRDLEALSALAGDLCVELQQAYDKDA